MPFSYYDNLIVSFSHIYSWINKLKVNVLWLQDFLAESNTTLVWKSGYNHRKDLQILKSSKGVDT